MPPEFVSDFNGCTTLYESFQYGSNKNLHAKCVGSRSKLADGSPGPYKWLSYGAVNRMMTNIGSGLLQCCGLQPGEHVGLYSANCIPWVLCEQACNAYSLVTVPLYDTLGADAVAYIVKHAQVKVVVCSRDKFASLLKADGVKVVVQYEDIDSEQLAAATNRGIKLFSLNQVETKGVAAPRPHIPPKAESCATICYTSGTTGVPKGAMISHRNMMSNLGGIALGGMDTYATDVHISYLPLPHMFERTVQAQMYNSGAAVGFFRGDILGLFDDVAALRPTVFVSVPRLYTRLRDKIEAAISTAGGLKATLFEQAYEAKKANLSQGILTHWLWDRLVFTNIRARLGGRVRLMVTGSAPISADTLDFLRICFCCPVIEGYGQTEANAAVTMTTTKKISAGSVGTVLPCCEIKLVDVPELNYLTTDTPHPRGEVCVRGNNVFMGYYNDPQQTAEAIDSEGWLHSGDIGLMTEDGSLRIIDRKKNIFKLAQGEYIAPEKIENVYNRSRFVLHCYVHGDSLQSTLVGIAVPDPEVLLAWASSQNRSSDLNALCQDEDVKAMILQDMVACGAAAQLRGFEQIAALHLDPETFMDTGIFTPTYKLKRNVARDRYRSVIDSLYRKSKL